MERATRTTDYVARKHGKVVVNKEDRDFENTEIKRPVSDLRIGAGLLKWDAE